MFKDDALSSVPDSPQGEAPKPTAHNRPDGAGTGGIAPDSKLFESVRHASRSAVDQHLAESPAPKRGQSFRPVPLESMGDGTDPASVAEGAAFPLAGNQPVAFDEETCRQVVDIACGLLNDGAAAVIRAIAKRETGDEKLAEEAAQSVRMAEKVESTIKIGAVACARKYSVKMAMAPEFMLGGGLLIWAGQVSLTGRALKAKGAELRERAKQERKAA